MDSVGDAQTITSLDFELQMMMQVLIWLWYY